uniref:Pyrroline-5-carboxylate reductase catalytic N-terminal domain-containing protein n=1 Tax=Nelumbo nucifera TaxID=4432 RepID=A0A822XE58_NELNU|nr:TPA_asm: hypothetical protein HUJ06_019930 [Nelumbo nucifera]
MMTTNNSVTDSLCKHNGLVLCIASFPNDSESTYEAACNLLQLSSLSINDRLEKSTKLKIAIIGFGNFGQFLAKTLVRQGHTVLAHSRSNYLAVARELGVSSFSDPDDLYEKHPELFGHYIIKERISAAVTRKPSGSAAVAGEPEFAWLSVARFIYPTSCEVKARSHWLNVEAHGLHT